jgi:hypothetical protein
MSPPGGRFTIESPRRRIAKERLEAIDSLWWWCVAWIGAISYPKSETDANKQRRTFGL